MLIRAALLALVLLVLLGGYRLWRRPPGRLARLDLADVGVEGPAIVQFTSTACAPCKTAAPVLADAAREAGLRFAQVDVGERPDVAGRYGIRTVPTIVVARRAGDVVAAWTSLPDRDALHRTARTALV